MIIVYIKKKNLSLRFKELEKEEQTNPKVIRWKFKTSQFYSDKEEKHILFILIKKKNTHTQNPELLIWKEINEGCDFSLVIFSDLSFY